MASNVERARVRWLCRRGMRELDILLGGFFEARYDQLSSAEQAAFAALLECQDPDVWSWILGEREVDDPALSGVVERIRRRA